MGTACGALSHALFFSISSRNLLGRPDLGWLGALRRAPASPVTRPRGTFLLHLSLPSPFLSSFLWLNSPVSCGCSDQWPLEHLRPWLPSNHCELTTLLLKKHLGLPSTSSFGARLEGLIPSELQLLPVSPRTPVIWLEHLPGMCFLPFGMPASLFFLSLKSCPSFIHIHITSSGKPP